MYRASGEVVRSGPFACTTGMYREDGSVRQRIFLILTAVWMIVIFSFSARPAEESARDSAKAGRLIGEIFVPGFENWSESEQTEFAEKIDHPVRKTAHASEYALLALLVSGVCIRKKKENARRQIFPEILIPWGVASVYAATDEFHQLFIPGRSGQVSDVMLDSLGALAGVAVLTVIRKAVSCFRNR